MLLKLYKSIRNNLAKGMVLCGLKPSLYTHDRNVLESTILPVFCRDERIVNILFVGCEWYTRKYEDLFRNKNYWTIDCDPTKTKYGARQHALVPLEEVGRHFANASFDLIICNGVLGWGLNDPDKIEKSFEYCYELLAPNGLLLLGWNDIPSRTPLAPDDVKSLKKFKKYYFEALCTHRYKTLTQNKHVFDFYIKSS